MEFERMNEAYRAKKYPKGSVFERNTGKNRTNSIILLVLLAIVAAALGAGLFFFIDLIITPWRRDPAWRPPWAMG